MFLLELGPGWPTAGMSKWDLFDQNTVDGSGMSPKVLEGSKRFQNIPEGSIWIWKVLN